MRQLRRLARCTPTTADRLPAFLSDVVTPLCWQAWENALRLHPDQEFACYIVVGISESFWISFNYGLRSSLRTCTRNMGSAYIRPPRYCVVLFGERASERAHGRVKGPVPSSAVTAQVSFWVIPKHHQPGKWWLILDLSSPQGRSVNDGISRELCSFTYISVAEIASVVLSLGQG